MDVKYSDKGQNQEYLQRERCVHDIQRSAYSVPIFLHYYFTSLFCPHVKIAVGRHFQYPRRILNTNIIFTCLTPLTHTCICIYYMSQIGKI